MTKEQFLEIQLNSISQVYSGKDAHCRCGCGGDYIATSYMINPRSEVNDTRAQRRLDRAKRLLIKGNNYSIGTTYINVVTGNDRCLTFYFDELKKS